MRSKNESLFRQKDKQPSGMNNVTCLGKETQQKRSFQD